MTFFQKTTIVKLALALQVLSLVAFISQIILDSIGKTPIHVPWEFHEAIEVAAVMGLSIGLIFGIAFVRVLINRNRKVEGQLRVASGEFHNLLKEHFAQWSLSNSEKDVAFFAVKGLSNAEIAELRGTGEGTVKAQLNAVYKKSGLESRTQLLGYFIEELMAIEAPEHPA
ncbi:MAG: helix-turn-helix transcriptional regulator [Rhodobacteraceae bacterium]|nr:helix-turn-helix transcriptional regulator [Paracoccaceae bacterium]